MNETKKPPTGKQIQTAAVDAILPAILLWVAIGQMINASSKLARNLGEAIVGIAVGLFALYAAIFYLLSRIQRQQ
ncbi:MAG TPA: hypothetical protein VLK27_09590 [Chthoniobacterales bacterium]|nr:hypothetical protein [Chthoniobacterales bacterium]